MEISFPIRGPLTEARFLERPNRFLVRARLPDGTVADAHLPDPGRLVELLIPGRSIFLRPEPEGRRRTRWTAVLAPTPESDGLVSLDTGLPNRLLARALEAGAVDELAGWQLVRAEVPHGPHRFDFLLEDGAGRRLFLEIKSVTLVEDVVALFPDAVTARGARHLRALSGLASSGEAEAAVLFLVQRSDARAVRAAPEIDPEFATALRDARRAGVRILARRCRVSRERVTLDGPLPVEQS